MRIILHLVLQSLLNKFDQDVQFIRREAPGQLLAYCINTPWMWVLKNTFSANVIKWRIQKPTSKLIKINVTTNLCLTTSLCCANGKIRASRQCNAYEDSACLLKVLQNKLASLSYFSLKQMMDYEGCFDAKIRYAVLLSRSIQFQSHFI